ncbi:M20/M25/M40 family metallo-hydrolase [Pseudomonas piscis]|uniref:M20/M25/M40 family metallo-hydrolase n=1 Tax=Pseudomonas piscis TaxID=2614538 RepID=A0ABY9NR04_9PSED|nr:M28 family peptidase [Pseudomonas piscis]WMN20720.1 M20/M25/M40 family metallo-hydrolase [Pseudomonas piscis]
MNVAPAASPTEGPQACPELLRRLLLARGPGGQEDEVRAICVEHLRRYCDETRIDPAGNVIGRFAGHGAPRAGSGICVMAHMDEIAMVVKRVMPDGTLQVVALGGANPVNFGMCPLDILGDQAILPGVLSFGSMHATPGSPLGRDVVSGNVYWKDVHVITRCCPQQLRAQGVRPGTRVVLSQHWRSPWRVGDAIAAHFMDDRAPLAAVLECARLLADRRGRLEHEVYLVLTTCEEESNAGAMYAAAHLACDTSIAVEVGPVLEEYATRLSLDPIINTGDGKGYYSRSVVTGLADAAQRCGLTPQYALLVDFASDASAVLSSGLCGQAGCLGIATENTHGYELVLDGAIDACARTLAEYLGHRP